MKKTTVENRFWCKVNSSDDESCWPWVAGVSKSTGYGQFQMNGAARPAHRVAYELTSGEIPDDLFVCHACDNKLCCNPAHLWLGTHAENMADMVAKGRQLCGEKNPNARLSRSDVCDIRDMPAYGFTQQQIADMFGVSQSHVSRIILREKWES